MSGLLTDSPWPMPGYCPQRLSRSPFIGPRTPKQKWKFHTVKRFTDSSPVIAKKAGKPAEDVVIAVSMGGGGAVYAVDQNGVQQWVSPTMEQGPVIAGIDTAGTVYSHTGEQPIIKTSADGLSLPGIDAGGDYLKSVLLGPEGTLYVYVETVGVAALAPDGTRLWRYEAGVGPPTLGPDGNLYFATSEGFAAVARDGGLFRAANNSLYLRDSNLLAAPDGTLYQCIGGLVLVVNPNGSKRGDLDVGFPCERSFGKLALGPDGTLYVKGARDDVASDAGQLTAVDTVALKVKWTFPTGGNAEAPTVGADGTIYFGSHDHFLYALAPDGSVVWKADLGSPVVGQPAIGRDGTLYVTTEGGDLYAFAR